MTVPQRRQPYVGVKEIQLFMNFFVREVYFRAFGDDEREPRALAAQASALEDYALGSGQEQFADRASLCRSLLFQFPTKGRRISTVVRTECGFIGRLSRARVAN